jgi:hypothetical protein
MVAFAERTHDHERKAAAELALDQIGAHASQRHAGKKARTTLADVDAALARGAFDDARRLALAARLSSGALAVRAAATGAAAFAKDQAELVLAADPQNGDARVAAAVAADLLRDDQALLRTMVDATRPGPPLSPLAGLLMAELLDRRVGPDAKRAWMDALGTASMEGSDPLLRNVATRH